MSSKVINITQDTSKKSGKRAKSASPSGKPSSASTSIIDNILKDRAASTGTNSPGKKLIIDLAKDNFILTDAKPTASSNLTKPQPVKPLVNKTIDPVIIDIDPSEFTTVKSKPKFRSPSISKSADDFGDEPMNIDDVSAVSGVPGRGTSARKSPASPAGSLGNSVISRAKMDKMQALDAVFLNSTPSPIPNKFNEELHTNHSLGLSTHKAIPKSTDPLDFIFNDDISNIHKPAIQLPPSTQANAKTSPINNHQADKNDMKIIKTVGASPSNVPQGTGQQSIDQDLTRQKLESVNRNIFKIQQKINEKGAKEKYAVMLKDLEKQKQKYESRLVTSVGAKSASPQPAYPPPSYKESMLGLQSAPSNNTNNPQRSPSITNIIPEKPRSPSPIKPQLGISKQVVSADEEKLATDRELQRIRELFPDSKQGKHQPRPKEVQSLFNVSNNLETLREKQRHLEQQHKKLEEQYAHKMKQIERMRTQKEEMTKLSVLEQERRKIYEMEQKLKRLDKEQWEEQQRLRKELQTINLVNLQAISRNNNKNVGEFYALKQQLSANNYNSGNRTTSISPANTTSPTSNVTPFRLTDWFAGFMSNRNVSGKKYQPEIFSDVALGLQQSNNRKQITGYHYYNTELPNTAWEEVFCNSTDTMWSVQSLGFGINANTLISSVYTELTPDIKNKDVPIIEQINKLSTQLGCPNTILIAKGLDFIVDKISARSIFSSEHITKNGQVLNQITRMLTHILDGLQIEQMQE